jgi:glutamate N-acetyltransferase / amino-acid N-acetyltransferase
MDYKKTSSGVCVDDFYASGVKEGKYGVAFIMNKAPCRCAAVFTTNTMKAAPVLLSMEKVKKGGLQAVIVNSGNANACVKGGMDDAKNMCEIAGKLLGLAPEKIAVSSTGIIGRKIDLAIIEERAKKAKESLANTPEGSGSAARAIMTTDTVKKELSFEYKGIEIGAICKGVGMLCPNMATMLCFITTNADLPEKDLQSCLKEAVDDSFNMTSVDGDMSTNDTVLLLSNGRKKCVKADFQEILSYLTKELAKLLVRDGEGATKYIEVEVRGAKDKKTARRAVQAIISSPLVKTAVYGENPNWGRIAAAMGKVIVFDFSKTDLSFESGGKIASVVEQGEMRDLAPARAVLKEKDIRIIVNLNSGKEKAVGYGCDLTEGYIKINAEYN